MSKIYDKSVSYEYSQYFASQVEIEASLASYSMVQPQLFPPENVINEYDHFAGGGVPLSYNHDQRKVFIDQADTHTLVIGPTGSKKSRLIAMPTVRILSYAKESMIISDPKGEIYNRCSRILFENGYDIFVLNLRNPEQGGQWNPLYLPYQFYCNGDINHAYEFVHDVAMTLTRDDASKSEVFWDNSAGTLFFGLTMLLFKYCHEKGKSPEDVHIGNVIALRKKMLSGDDSSIRHSALWEYAKQDPLISSALIGTVESAKDTRGGILSTFDQKMQTFSIQPNLIELLARDNVPLKTIDKHPTAIFLVTPDEKTGYHKLVSLFVKQSYEYMIHMAQRANRESAFGSGKMILRVNYLLDEFSALPTIDDMPAMITAARSRNIRFMLIVQSKHQMTQRYGDEAETIQSNCNNWIYLFSRELSLLEDLSKLCGQTKDDRPEPILSIAALQHLDKDSGEALILSGRNKPYIAHLPDINLYETQFQSFPVPINVREQTDITQLHFDLPEIEELQRKAAEQLRQQHINHINQIISK